MDIIILFSFYFWFLFNIYFFKYKVKIKLFIILFNFLSFLIMFFIINYALFTATEQIFMINKKLSLFPNFIIVNKENADIQIFVKIKPTGHLKKIILPPFDSLIIKDAPLAISLFIIYPIFMMLFPRSFLRNKKFSFNIIIIIISIILYCYYFKLIDYSKNIGLNIILLFIYLFLPAIYMYIFKKNK